jgi:hypothetical protein
MNTPVYFTKNDTNFYKGIGILMIVMHNYLHFQDGFFLENEASFKPENFQNFIDYLIPFRWTDSFTAFFSFFGHYGVQIFIFFSAYGLTIQANKANGFPNYIKYLSHRLKKIYFLLFFGVLIFLCIHYLSQGEFYGWKNTLEGLFSLMTSYSNFSFFSNTLYKYFSGPFWFFGLMVQLYIVFPFVYKHIKKWNIYFVFSVVYIFIWLAHVFISRKTGFTLFGTVFGHLPEVILGIYFANKNITKPNWKIFILAIPLFILSQKFGSAFPFSFLSITIIILFIVESLKKYVNDFFTKFIIYTGQISMILFVVNGPFRMFPFFSNTIHEIRDERIFLYLLILFPISHLLFKLYTFLEKKLNI